MACEDKRSNLDLGGIVLKNERRLNYVQRESRSRFPRRLKSEDKHKEGGFMKGGEKW